jgi:hypothetical protein
LIWHARIPMLGRLALVRVQASYLGHPALPEASRHTIKNRLEALARTLPRLADSFAPRLITATGKAVLVDLEKLRYSYPPLDLAHATRYTSTTWDVDASSTMFARVSTTTCPWRASTGCSRNAMNWR